MPPIARTWVSPSGEPHDVADEGLHALNTAALAVALVAAHLATTGRLKRGALPWVTAAATLAAADDIADVLAHAASAAFSAALVAAAADFLALGALRQHVRVRLLLRRERSLALRRE